MKKPFSWKLRIALFATAVFLLIGGCSKTDEQDKITESIKTVVGLQMNAPDEKALSQNYDTPEEDSWLEDYTAYLKETFGPYFTESTTEQYIMTNEFVSFHHAADRFNYELKVRNIDVEQNEVTPTNYNFTVELDYKKDGEITPIEVTGVAIMRDDKIAKISYLGDKKLLRNLFSGGLE